MSKPILGILGFSDGDPAAHKMLKPVVQAQIDAIVDALKADGRVEVGDVRLICFLHAAVQATPICDFLYSFCLHHPYY